MDRRTFLCYRVGFLDLPASELQTCLSRVRDGASWWQTFEDAARRLEDLARGALREGRRLSAAEAWLWSAAAHQASSLGWHLERQPDRPGGKAVLKQRRRAISSYRRALALDPRLGEPLELVLEEGGGTVQGYLRRPRRRGAPLVVLLNGLDSLCEAELHAFGNRLLSRGMAVLALDLPGTFGSSPRRPLHRLEAVARKLAVALIEKAGAGPPWGAFGVSFGGYLVARLMAGEEGFKAGVAVSPPARIPAPLVAPRDRFRRMLEVAFDAAEGGGLEALAEEVRVDGLGPPAGRLRVYQMEGDELFGGSHARALRAWAGEAAEIRRVPGEHVATSRIHQWLPEACDWLGDALRAAREGGGTSWRAPAGAAAAHCAGV